jgi:aspartyl-tRNA(Asn)/glutamyl-tRNA(Gln) amidotransferase subunit B
MIDAADIVKPVVGLEIHVELATATKMFCRCRNRFGDPPNTNVCPVCIGMPGVLPVMNRKAVELAMKVGLALNCTMADFTKWDRKSYYYPDLPKNYQISQYDLPLSVNGWMEAPLGDGTSKRVRIRRAHLEEDAGKNIHDHPAHTGVDLNRAGVPLLEIVSEPDMNTAEEVISFARAMHRLVRWLGASEANMQMGQMRFEPNINLHVSRQGRTYKTPIVEVKNLNSFRALERTVEYEIRRQYDAWLEDPDGFSLERVGKQNRGYDDAREQTVFQREKEEAHDYRYFPDPDLVPVVVDDPWRDSIRAGIGELPLARRSRYMESYKLTFKEADALTQDARSGDLLDAAVAAGADPKRVANALLGQCAATANRDGVTIFEAWSRKRPGKSIPELAASLSKPCIQVEERAITATAFSQVIDIMIETGEEADVVVEREGLRAVTDGGAIEAWVDQAIAANPRAVADVKEGGKKQKKAFGFLLGQVMQMSRGTAQPAEVQKLLQGKLGL